MFEITHTHGLARNGIFHTKHGKVATPTVFPVHNLGADAGWNTPEYWKIFPEINTGMFNASYLYMDKRNRLKEIMEKGIHRYLDFPGIAFVDSGGFIYEKYKISVTQNKIMKIQEDIGADIASTLDSPILLRDRNPENSYITKSVESAKKALILRKDTEMLLFASIHGYDPIVIRNVIRHLNKHGDFDGFAIGSLMKHFSNYRWLVDLVYTARKEVRNKPLHVYGLSGVLISQLLIFLGVDSMDSSAFIIAAGKRNYIIPGSGRVSIHRIEDAQGICNCKICSSYPFDFIKQDRRCLALHNLWAIWREIKTVKLMMREGELEKYLKERFDNNPWAKAAFTYASKRIKFGLVGRR